MDYESGDVQVRQFTVLVMYEIYEALYTIPGEGTSGNLLNHMRKNVG